MWLLPSCNHAATTRQHAPAIPGVFCQRVRYSSGQHALYHLAFSGICAGTLLGQLVLYLDQLVLNLGQLLLID